MLQRHLKNMLTLLVILHGIVSVSGLTKLFPDYDPDILICFLQKMELCQEMNPAFLETTNLHQLSERGGREERLLFFPSLLYSDRPDKMTSKVHQFGWCLQCTMQRTPFLSSSILPHPLITSCLQICSISRKRQIKSLLHILA